MKTLRIFISSPGDVAEEREKAKQVIADLQRRYGEQAKLVPVLWEELAIPATASFQEGIDFVLSAKHRIDIAVFILWSRLGSPLGPCIRKPDGSSYLSGTEREFDLMLAAFEQSSGSSPIIIAYTRRDEEGFNDRLDPRKHGDDALDELIKQRKLVKQFIRERFQDKDGRNLRAYHSYREPVGFAQRLHVHLREAIQDILSLESVGATWTEAPYRGLEVFDIRHSPIFFGRDEETCEVLQRLRDQQRLGKAFVCIVGASGSGKSSLARAGVAATLIQRSFEDGLKEWRCKVLIPGIHAGDLVAGLIEALATAVPEMLSNGVTIADIKSSLMRDPSSTVKLAIEPAFMRASLDAGGSIRVMIILDQMEELWTDSQSILPERREHFLEAIESLVAGEFISCVATLRSDFYAQAQLSSAFLRLKGEHGQADLTPPGPAALHRMITAPARQSGLRFEQSDSGTTLADILLNEADCIRDSLPVLEYALRELYERRSGDTLSFSSYNGMGGLRGAVGQLAERTINLLDVEIQAALGGLFWLLVNIDGTGAAVRRRAAYPSNADMSPQARLLRALVNARFATSHENENHEPSVILAHDYLLSAWPRLSDWIQNNHRLVGQLRRLEEFANLWDMQGRKQDYLLNPGEQIHQATTLLKGLPIQVSPNIQEFIAASSSHARATEQSQAVLRHDLRSCFAIAKHSAFRAEHTFRDRAGFANLDEKRMAKLLDAMLDIQIAMRIAEETVLKSSFVGRSHATQNRERIDLVKILLEDRRLWERYAKIEKELELRIDVESLKQFPPLYVSSTELRSAFYQVVMNSIKASRSTVRGDAKTERCGRIEIRGHLSERLMRVDVVDFGIGFPQEEVSQIFRPEYRSKSAQMSWAGEGNGLWMSRSIMEGFGGTLVITQTHMPTVVSFMFPRALANPPSKGVEG